MKIYNKLVRDKIEEIMISNGAKPITRILSDEEYKSLLNRLSRIEGQIRGIRSMVENDAYCTDILMQASAANAALNAFSRELLSNHIHTCVVENIRQGKDEIIDELIDTLKKMMR